MVKTSQIALTIIAVQAVSVLATPFGMDASNAGIFARAPGRKGRGGSGSQAAKPRPNSQPQSQPSNPGPQQPGRESTFSNIATPENVNSGLQVANGLLNLVNQNKGYTSPGIVPNSPTTPTTPTDASTVAPSRRDISLERRKGGKGGGGKSGSKSSGSKSGSSKSGAASASGGFDWLTGLFNWNNNNEQQKRREESAGLMLERRRKQRGGTPPSSPSNQQQQLDVSQVIGLTNGLVTSLTPQPAEGTVSRREEPQLEALERRGRRGGSRSGSLWTSDNRANAISQGSAIITGLTTQSPEEAAGRVDAAVMDAMKTVKVREEALDVRDFEDDLEARDFEDDFELEARDFDDDFELEAREFDDLDMDELD